jgi:hypothetical protein
MADRRNPRDKAALTKAKQAKANAKKSLKKKKKTKKKTAKKKTMLVAHPKGKPRVNKKKVAGSMATVAGVAGMVAAPSLVGSGVGMLTAGLGNKLAGKSKGDKKTQEKSKAMRASRKSRAGKGSSMKAGTKRKKKK